MNERIQKLAEQANLQLIIDEGDFDLRKFADKLGESIINECVEVLSDKRFDNVRPTMNIAQAMINQHFGVEE